MSDKLQKFVRAHEKRRERILKVRRAFIERQQPPLKNIGRLKSYKPLSKAEEAYVVAAWPQKFRNIFIISIRPKRLGACLKRMGGLAKYVTIIPACNGAEINRSQWEREGTIRPNCQLNGGKLGCFESHCRMWRYIVEHNLPQALILEDDVRLHPSAPLLDRLIKGLAHIEKHNLDWDLLFFGRSYKKRNNKKRLTSRLVIPADFWGLFAYVVKRDCAIFMLQHPEVKTFRIPVDVVLSDMGKNNQVNILAFVPEICNQVPAPSDTNGIL